MYNTGLSEQEKESLIKWLVTKGEIKEIDGKKIFCFYDNKLDLEEPFSPSHLLYDAVRNVSNQVVGK